MFSFLAALLLVAIATYVAWDLGYQAGKRKGMESMNDAWDLGYQAGKRKGMESMNDAWERQVKKLRSDLGWYRGQAREYRDLIPPSHRQ